MNKFFEKRFTFLCNKSIVPILIWDCGCVCVWQCEKEKKEKVTIRSQSINQNQSLSFFVMVSSSGHFEERSMYQLFQLKERNFGGDKNIKTQTNRKKKFVIQSKTNLFFLLYSTIRIGMRFLHHFWLNFRKKHFILERFSV